MVTERELEKNAQRRVLKVPCPFDQALFCQERRDNGHNKKGYQWDSVVGLAYIL